MEKEMLWVRRYWLGEWRKHCRFKRHFQLQNVNVY